MLATTQRIIAATAGVTIRNTVKQTVTATSLITMTMALTMEITTTTLMTTATMDMMSSTRSCLDSSRETSAGSGHRDRRLRWWICEQ